MNTVVFMTGNEQLMKAMMYTGIALVVICLLLLIPLKVQSTLTVPFSFRTFGIRKIRRWHSRTDTLANLMLWISAIFCVLAPWIPYSPLIYLAWLILTWLATVSRAIRLTRVTKKGVKLTVIFFVNLVFAIGMLAAMGFYNNFALWIRSFLFANDIVSGEGLRLMYYLSSVQPGAYLVQTLLLLLPVCALWGQFKYMRLENTFKAANLGFYVIKNLVFVAILALLGFAGNTVLENVYNVEHGEWTSSESFAYPLDREEAAGLEYIIPQNENPVPQDTQNEVPNTHSSAEPSEVPAVPEDPNAPIDPNADPYAQPNEDEYTDPIV